MMGAVATVQWVEGEVKKKRQCNEKLNENIF